MNTNNQIQTRHLWNIQSSYYLLWISFCIFKLAIIFIIFCILSIHLHIKLLIMRIMCITFTDNKQNKIIWFQSRRHYCANETFKPPCHHVYIFSNWTDMKLTHWKKSNWKKNFFPVYIFHIFYFLYLYLA